MWKVLDSRIARLVHAIRPPSARQLCWSLRRRHTSLGSSCGTARQGAGSGLVSEVAATVNLLPRTSADDLSPRTAAATIILQSLRSVHKEAFRPDVLRSDFFGSPQSDITGILSPFNRNAHEKLTVKRGDDDDDESKSYVLPLLQLETFTNHERNGDTLS